MVKEKCWKGDENIIFAGRTVQACLICFSTSLSVVCEQIEFQKYVWEWGFGGKWNNEFKFLINIF